MSILKQFKSRVLPTLPKMADPCNRPHPRDENLLPPSFSTNFYEVPNSFGALFFKLKRNRMSLAPICS